MKHGIILAGALALFLGACAPASEEKARFLWIDAPANFQVYADSEENIAADCERIAGMGFTDIVVDVRPTSGNVLFRSELAPPLTKLARWHDGALRYVERKGDFDYLRAFIDSGHAAGLRVHAGINMMVGGFRCDAGNIGLVYERPGLKEWCSVDNTPGGLVNHADDSLTVGGRFLDPANPEVREFLLGLLGELAGYEGLDGIVMDRCRYDDYAMDAGYTEAARKAFSEYIGGEPERWPVFEEAGHIFLDKEPDSLEVKWLTFRCKQIRDFVAEAVEKVHSTAPGLPLGIYVGAWFSEYYRSGVNWTSPRYDLASEESTYASWVTPEYQATGLADLVDFMILGAYCPADNIHGDVEKTMKGFARLGRKRLCGDVRFVCGPDIGNERGFEKGGRGDLMKEIAETMLAEADGLFIFDLCHIRMFDYWDSFTQAL